MIYLIGGAARVGKTTLAKMILKRNEIPFDSTDMLWHAFKDCQPERAWKDGWENIPDQFFPFLRKFVDHAVQTLPNYVIEGDSFFPAHAAALMKDFPVKACFLGMTKMNLADIKKYTEHNNWIDSVPQAVQETIPAKLVQDSAMFASEAKRLRIPYFDLTENRKENLEAAYRALFSE